MVRDVDTEDDSNDILSWREDGRSKITMSEKLTTEQRKQLEVLLQKHQHVFKGKPGRIKTIQHFIHTIDDSPVK